MGEHDGEWHGPADGPPVSVGNHGALTPDGLPDDSIRRAVDRAKPPKKLKRNRKAVAVLLYVEDRGRICRNREGNPVPLCNFTARIVEEAIFDDGENSHMAFVIEGRLFSGEPLPRIEVAAGSYNGMAWVTAQWGARASIQAGQATKDHLRAAIQELSGAIARRTVYSHTGWRKIGAEWLYLHAGGALGANGSRPGVEVNPGTGNMGHYRLPDPPEGEALAAAVRASLSLLDLAPHKPEVGALLLACIYRAPLAEAAPIDHAAWLVGYTGARKSEAAALVLAHFGQGFAGARHFPASWTDSPGVLEVKAHAAKDAVFIVDDFKPHGAKSEIDGFHSKADKLIRGVGNQAGRGRLFSDLKQRPAYHARGFVLATGEDIPRGLSLRARMTVASLSRNGTDPRQGDIDLDRLTALQAHAWAGDLARAMAGFIRWLAPQLDTLKQTLPDDIRNRRDQAAHQGMKGHSRAPSDFASLTAGIGALTRFAVECGTLSEPEARAFEERCRKALFGLMEDQAEHQGNQDDVNRFLSLLSSSLSSGRCHVFDLESGEGEGGKGIPHGPMKNVRAFGWIQDGRGEYSPKGPCVGYLENEILYLDGEAAFAAVTSYAREQGGVIEITQSVLFTRIHERGLLAKTGMEGGKLRRDPKKTILGRKRRVYHLKLSALFEHDA